MQREATRAAPGNGDFLADVWAGLAASHKTLPCKYLYDARGSDLFEAITSVDAYYPARADLEATRDHADAIAQAMCPPGARATSLVELGSGSSRKTRVLLDRLSLARYVPFDISQAALDASVPKLRAAYPDLPIEPVCADFTGPLLWPGQAASRHVVYFPGTTIGNLAPSDAERFLWRVRRAVAPDGGALIGVDGKNGRAVLERAYDDPEGITAAFNLNLLARINGELGADFDLEAFEHQARWEPALGRVEMHLVSQRPQRVDVGGRRFAFEAGESIRTEESYKYDADDFAALASKAGLDVVQRWTDRQRRFTLYWLEPA